MTRQDSSVIAHLDIRMGFPHPSLNMVIDSINFPTEKFKRSWFQVEE